MPIGGSKYLFSKDNVDKAPDEHGVYELYDGDELIYIGRAAGTGVTIRTRLQAHRRGDEGRCTQRATHYRREVNSRPIGREAELIREYVTRYGRLPRCNERFA
jgi:excinuclease UvrABC nuclease subunit